MDLYSALSFKSFRNFKTCYNGEMCCDGKKLAEVVKAEVKKAMEEAGLAAIPAMMQGLEGRIIPMLSSRLDSLERGMVDLRAREDSGELVVWEADSEERDREEPPVCDDTCIREESQTSEESFIDGAVGGMNISVELEEAHKEEPEEVKVEEFPQVVKEEEGIQAEKTKSVKEVRKMICELRAKFSSSDTRRRNMEVAELEMEHNPRVSKFISWAVGERKVWRNAETLMLIFSDYVSSRVFGSWPSLDPAIRRNARDSSEFSNNMLVEEAELLWPGSSGLIAYRAGPNAIEKVYYDLYSGSGTPVDDNKAALRELAHITGARRLTVFGRPAKLEMDIKTTLNNLDAALAEQVKNELSRCT